MIKGKLHQLKRAAFQQCPTQKYTRTQDKNSKYNQTKHITTVKTKGIQQQKLITNKRNKNNTNKPAFK